MNKTLWVVLGVVGLIVVVALFVGGSYVTARNTMVQKNADVDAGVLRNIDVDLQRRADLIPEPGGDGEGLRQCGGDRC